MAERTIASTRPLVWQKIRSPFETWFAALPLPNVNPDILSLASVLMAVLFVMAERLEMHFVAWIFLAILLLFDGVDGAVARRYKVRKTNKQKLHGQLVDFSADRLSEGILFLLPAFFVPWFLFFVINVALTILSVSSRRALAMPLRQAFFIVVTIYLLF